jgi:hypothetical protein
MAWKDGINGSGACCWSAYYAGSIDAGITWSTPERVPGTGAGWLGFNVAATPSYAHVLVTSSWTAPDVYNARRSTGGRRIRRHWKHQRSRGLVATRDMPCRPSLARQSLIA